MLEELASKLPSETDKKYIDELVKTPCRNDEIQDTYDMFTGSVGFFTKLARRHDIESPTPLDEMLYIKDSNLCRDTICSSYAALVVGLAERADAFSKMETPLNRMDEQQKKTFKSEFGFSVFVRPMYVMPSYLELGMKLSGAYDVVGQFINLGSSSNAHKKASTKSELVRPHADYITRTWEFVDKIGSDVSLINMPDVKKASGYKVIGHGFLPHTRDLADSKIIYDRILASRLETAGATRAKWWKIQSWW